MAGESVQSSQTSFTFHNVLVVVVNLLAIISICFSYSFSAFKLPLKKHMSGWNEADLNFVYQAAAIGQNTVVHLGMFCDRFGSPSGYLISALLKAVGCFGMYYCAVTHIENVWLFGAFFLMDTQGMSSGLIMGLKEVQRASPGKFGGIMASLSKAAFGFGAVVHVSLFDYVYTPDVEKHFLCAGILGVSTMLLCAMIVPSKPPEAPSKKVDDATPQEYNKEEKKALKLKPSPAEETGVMEIICSKAYLACFLGMFVTWGGGMVWTANLASFSAAAGMSNPKQIRSYFYTAKTLSSLFIGPISDLGGREFWYSMTVWSMCLSIGIMYYTNSQSMLLAATVAGLSWGSIATLIPIMSKKLSFKNMGTLYSLAKFAGLLSSIGWNYYAAQTSQALTKPDEKNCSMVTCYNDSFRIILLTTMPVALFMVYWTADSLLVANKKTKKD